MTFRDLQAVMLAAVLCAAGGANAGEVHVAVAANFILPMQKIAAAFETQTIHRVKMAIGSTGGVYSQIRNGAPFDIFMAADDETPARLQAEGLAVAGSRFTYARGRIVLWSANPSLVDGAGKVLMDGSFDKIAIANPKLAPYGRAAIEVMEHNGLYAKYLPKIVQGENIGQAFQFVATGAAPVGFVALSQVMLDGKVTRGSAWIVPASMHAPMRQDAVVLKHGAANAAAGELADFIRSAKARDIIRAYGYDLP